MDVEKRVIYKAIGQLQKETEMKIKDIEVSKIRN